MDFSELKKYWINKIKELYNLEYDDSDVDKVTPDDKNKTYAFFNKCNVLVVYDENITKHSNRLKKRLKKSNTISQESNGITSKNYIKKIITHIKSQNEQNEQNKLKMYPSIIIITNNKVAYKFRIKKRIHSSNIVLKASSKAKILMLDKIKKHSTKLHFFTYDSCRTLFHLITMFSTKPHTKLIISICLSVIVIGFSIADYIINMKVHISRAHDYYPLYIAGINIVLAITIIIYIFLSNTFSKRISSFKNYFKSNDSYDKECSRLYAWLHFGWGTKPIMKETVKENHGEKKLILICTITFWVIWFGAASSFLGFAFYNIPIQNALQKGAFGCIVTVVLFLLSISLEAYSCFGGLVTLRFLHNISRNSNQSGILSLKHNRYLPSQSSGFKKLMSNINLNTTCYVIESILFMLVFVCTVALSTNLNPSAKKSILKIDLSKDWLTLIFFISYFLLCVGGSIVMYLAPKYMMRRILRRWIFHSRDTLEKEIEILKSKTDTLVATPCKKFCVRINGEKRTINITRQSITDTSSKIKEINEQILQLDKEMNVFKGEIINLVLVGATFVLSLFPLIYQLYAIVIK